MPVSSEHTPSTRPAAERTEQQTSLSGPHVEKFVEPIHLLRRIPDPGLRQRQHLKVPGLHVSTGTHTCLAHVTSQVDAEHATDGRASVAITSVAASSRSCRRVGSHFRRSGKSSMLVGVSSGRILVFLQCDLLLTQAYANFD